MGFFCLFCFVSVFFNSLNYSFCLQNHQWMPSVSLHGWDKMNLEWENGFNKCIKLHRPIYQPNYELKIPKTLQGSIEDDDAARRFASFHHMSQTRYFYPKIKVSMCFTVSLPGCTLLLNSRLADRKLHQAMIIIWNKLILVLSWRC